MNIHESVSSLKGVGPKTAELFSKLNINTINDLIFYYPRTYLTYGDPVDICDAKVGEKVAIFATIRSNVDVRRLGRLTVSSCTIKDSTGSLKVTWFNSPYIKKTIYQGQTYVFCGVLTEKRHQLILEHPEFFLPEKYEEMKKTLFPVYGLTSGLSNKTVVKAVKQALNFIDEINDDIPSDIIEENELANLPDAIKGVHYPEDFDQLIRCRKRLVFDEFFKFIAGLRIMRQASAKEENTHRINDFDAANEFISGLPYELTDGQKTAFNEIKEDLSGNCVMNRLLQGDVGSGKTVVAELAMLSVVKCGYQAALMAPTEVLAIQHFEDIKKHMEPFGVKVALLVGSVKQSERRKLYEDIENGDADIIIGTNAIIQERVRYKDLGLVVTDEQHRFGVRQREKLSDKGTSPHVLVMSATPIPRTLAIIMYGDLDISVMKDMPKNRLPIKNCVVGREYRNTAYKFMFDQIKEGHQIYIICPMVEDSENVEAENVMDYQESLKEIFPDSVRIDHIHGRMSAEEKNDIMFEYYKGNIDILVATTVIEVGINNPNATVMMIENSERFGLAALHQLRGRVGRGSAQSYCIFMCGSDSEDAKKRLDVLGKSNDGFLIANEDLKQRGPGDFFGIRQSGDISFILGDIYSDADMLKAANYAVEKMEKRGEDLSKYVSEGKFEVLL